MTTAHADLARATLSNVRRELVANRADLARQLPYHSRVADALGPVLQRGGPLTLEQLLQQTGFDGTKPVEFTTTAWDLALATEALSYLDPDLAFDLSAVYKRQQSVARFADQYLESLFNSNPLAERDVSRGLLAMENYFRETAREEKQLIAQYDALLPKIEVQLR